jgi:cytochrome c
MRISAVALAVALSFALVSAAGEQQTGQTQGQAQAQAKPPTRGPSGLGRPPTQAELRAWDLSISPDGTELPPGSGNVATGAQVFTQRGCAACHGPTGIEGPGPVLVGGEATLSTNYFPIKYWPYAPPIWDFINRAMPYDKPGVLRPDEVYALMAFLLYKNDIIKENEVMDAKTLAKVQMPARANYKGVNPPNWTPSSPRGFKIVP